MNPHLQTVVVSMAQSLIFACQLAFCLALRHNQLAASLYEVKTHHMQWYQAKIMQQVEYPRRANGAGSTPFQADLRAPNIQHTAEISVRTIWRGILIIGSIWKGKSCLKNPERGLNVAESLGRVVGSSQYATRHNEKCLKHYIHFDFDCPFRCWKQVVLFLVIHNFNASHQILIKYFWIQLNLDKP